MKNKLFSFVLTGLLFINTKVVFSQSSNPLRTQIGIKVTPDEFKTIVEKIIIEMKKSEFKAVFNSNYPDMIVKKLHLTVAHGMGYYSEKYKVFWTGYPDSNSLYNIVKSKRVN